MVVKIKSRYLGSNSQVEQFEKQACQYEKYQFLIRIQTSHTTNVNTLKREYHTVNSTRCCGKISVLNITREHNELY